MRLPAGSSRALPWAALVLLAACSSRSQPISLPSAPAVAAVEHGLLVDVYALRSGVPTEDGEYVRYARDVLVGYERPAAGDLYEDLPPHPDDLQPRLLIRRVAGSAEFAAALGALRAGVRRLDLEAPPAARVVARDAALELRFAHPVDGRAGLGAAVQLSALSGAAARAVPVRVAVRGDRLLIDPVLLGAEAERAGVPDGAAGWPVPADPASANLQLQLGGVDASRGTTRNAAGGLVIAFRAAHESEPDGGVAATRRAPRLVGELPFVLERVDDVDEHTQQVTLFKRGIVHEIDRGDGLRVFARGVSLPVAVTEIVAEPADDEGRPAVQHVRALVVRTAGLEENDPTHLPGYPAQPQSPAGEAWLVQNAPHAELVAEFRGERAGPAGRVQGDDPRWFVTFAPAALPGPRGAASEPNENVSPFAAAVLRFSAPIDLRTARPHDTLFFATRDLLDPAAQRAFVSAQGLDPQAFDAAKYATPHLVHSRVFDVTGGQTVLRLQPALGFYLDEAIRRADEGQPFASKQFRYFAHVVGGTGGLAGHGNQPLELGFEITGRAHFALPFSLDTRKTATGAPFFADNLAVSVVRRFGAIDEDEHPSYYQPAEVRAAALPDLFGAVVHAPGGILEGRPTSRVRRAVDDLNQPAAPPQQSVLRHCPVSVSGEAQLATSTATAKFNLPLQNPLNPYGARLQTVWREIDMGLSRTDPHDFNLDVEAMFLAAFTQQPVESDEFPRLSAFLGHAERRPEPCVGAFSALPTFEASGLVDQFAANYVANQDLSGGAVPGPAPHAAFVDRAWTIDPERVTLDPTGTYRYLQLPEFQQPYFVWRDETVMLQGGASGVGSDVDPTIYRSYIISPFAAGQGTAVGSPGFWNNQREFRLAQPAQPDPFTGGGIAALGLPLLVDFQTHPAPSIAQGINGLQVSLAVPSAPQPGFRSFSAGGVFQGQETIVGPASQEWVTAAGGVSPLTGARTLPQDNVVFWMMADFLKRSSVATAGFVDLANPHRMPARVLDPRLGPYAAAARGAAAAFTHDVSPAGGALPSGTEVLVEFRGAGAVDPQPWRALVEGYAVIPDPTNFPLDPQKAGDAHLRKFDDRPVGGQSRDYWTYPYNRNVTDYTPDPAALLDPAFTGRFAGPHETFEPHQVRYFNWRLVLRNADADRSVAPALDTFALSYRLEPAR